MKNQRTEDCFISTGPGKISIECWSGAFRLTGLIVFLCLICIKKSNAQDEVDYSVHANIIYHFTKYINWPEEKKSGDFVIGVYGDTPLYDELKKTVEGKKAGNQNIIVKKISLSTTSFNCHILFVSDEESSRMKKLASQTKNDPVLLVSETEGLAKKGACINFIIVNERLRLEINKQNIEERNLSIASELLKLGIPVK